MRRGARRREDARVEHQRRTPTHHRADDLAALQPRSEHPGRDARIDAQQRLGIAAERHDPSGCVTCDRETERGQKRSAAQGRKEFLTAAAREAAGRVRRGQPPAAEPHHQHEIGNPNREPSRRAQEHAQTVERVAQLEFEQRAHSGRDFEEGFFERTFAGRPAQIAGRAAGCSVMWCSWGLGSRDGLAVDAEAHSPGDIARLLGA